MEAALLPSIISPEQALTTFSSGHQSQAIAPIRTQPDAMTHAIEVRVLTSQEDLNSYRRLLFDVYINEAGWKFNPTNPSGIRVSGHQLLDDRDDIATCFGVFSQGRLVGGARLCGRYQDRFEIHGYQPERDLAFLDLPNLVEGSRAVLHPGFRGTGVFMLLVLHVFEFCRRNHLFIFTIPSAQSVMRLYKRIGMPAIEGCRFRFEPEDPEEAQLFLADSEDVLDTVIKKLGQLLRAS
ncbi:GNAT family N-acetyltransferase [Pyxidicoccus trucidator]|uniref:GNAT family N-acetyltransferase n=1 Tax=Pyxidicoccus trucidator TaxID=2709662 RepID=UPI0013DAE2DA|nr:GNAT family N-acetyltransferase [Pyxidicoccus trucidator]